MRLFGGIGGFLGLRCVEILNSGPQMRDSRGRLEKRAMRLVLFSPDAVWRVTQETKEENR